MYDNTVEYFVSKHVFFRFVNYIWNVLLRRQQKFLAAVAEVSCSGGGGRVSPFLLHIQDECLLVPISSGMCAVGVDLFHTIEKVSGWNAKFMFFQ